MRKTTILLFAALLTHGLCSAQCWKLVSAGNVHSLAIKTDGTLWAWGYNTAGSIGDGTVADKHTPVQVGTVNNWRVVAAGWNSSLAIKTDGTLWAWGKNNYGQLGDGTTANKLTPIRIGTDTNWVMVSAGYHTLALKSDGSLWAWGANNSGQLGDGTNVNKSIPTRVGTGNNWRFISAGQSNSFAIQANGTLWGWGENLAYQLGDSTTMNRNVPVQVGNANNWLSVDAGYVHTLGIKTNGSLWAWGAGGKGEFGNGGAPPLARVPIQVGTDMTWAAVIGGTYSSYALKQNGTLWSTGDNVYGELADGSVTPRSTFMQIGTDTNWRFIAGGWDHGMALKSNNTLSIWGANTYGQIGDGTITNRITLYNVACGAAPTAVHEPAPAAGFVVSPVPAQSMITISGAGLAAMRGFELRDMAGKVILAGTGQVSRIDLSSLSAGMYLLRLYAADAIQTLKLMKE